MALKRKRSEPTAQDEDDASEDISEPATKIQATMGDEDNDRENVLMRDVEAANRRVRELELQLQARQQGGQQTTGSNIPTTSSLKFGKRRRRKNNQVSPKVQRYMYKIRQRRHVSLAQKQRMSALGKKWQPVLQRAREIAFQKRGSKRITRRDVALARAESQFAGM